MQRQTATRFVKTLIILLTAATQCLTAAAFAQTGEIPPELIRYADFVFFNGQVLTADADKDFTVAEAVAVRGRKQTPHTEGPRHNQPSGRSWNRRR